MTPQSPPIFKAGVDAQALAKILVTADIGDVVPYLKLSEAIKRNVQGVARGSLETAREICRRDHQIVFACVKGIGLKRLNDADIVDNEKGSVTRIKRMARRSGKRLSVVKPENLAPMERTSYNVTSATLGAIGLCVKTSSQNKLQQKALDTAKLEVGDVMKLFAS